MMYRLLVLATAASAFTIPFGSLQKAPTPFYLSDVVEAAPDAAEDAAAAAVDGAKVEEEASAEEVEASAGDDAVAEEEVVKEEEAAAEKPVEKERFTAFVGNLPFDTEESEIRKLFEPHGTVELLSLPVDKSTGRRRGFAFVDMASAEELQTVIDEIDGITISGRMIRVNKSVPKEQVERSPRPEAKKIYVGNIPWECTPEELSEHFTQFGPVFNVYIPSDNQGNGRGFGFVTMPVEAATKAIEETNGTTFQGRSIVVNEPLPPGQPSPRRRDPTTKMYVGNLSFYTEVETLVDLFGEFGEVLDCYLPEDADTGRTRGFGFVTMRKDEALDAIADLDGCELEGRSIRVNEARPKGAAPPPGEYENDGDDGDDFNNNNY